MKPHQSGRRLPKLWYLEINPSGIFFFTVYLRFLRLGGKMTFALQSNFYWICRIQYNCDEFVFVRDLRALTYSRCKPASVSPELALTDSRTCAFNCLYGFHCDVTVQAFSHQGNSFLQSKWQEQIEVLHSKLSIADIYGSWKNCPLYWVLDVFEAKNIINKNLTMFYVNCDGWQLHFLKDMDSTLSSVL